jgi:hypothetical protein
VTPGIILDVPYTEIELRIHRTMWALVCLTCGLPTLLCPFSGSHPEGMCHTEGRTPGWKLRPGR